MFTFSIEIKILSSCLLDALQMCYINIFVLIRCMNDSNVQSEKTFHVIEYNFIYSKLWCYEIHIIDYSTEKQSSWQLL